MTINDLIKGAVFVLTTQNPSMEMTPVFQNNDSNVSLSSDSDFCFSVLCQNKAISKSNKAPYLTFYNENGMFTLEVKERYKNWNGTIEWSIDTNDWALWDGKPIASSDTGYLYLRGSGNSKITSAYESARFVFSDGALVKCIGDIENLLDYSMVSEGNHPRMDNFCFAYLFYGCEGLISAPTLSPAFISSGCYYKMFQGCVNLIIPPKILATQVGPNGCESMFEDCISLSSSPNLNILYASSYCYKNMFSNCTSLLTPPRLLATHLDASCYKNMFSGCISLTSAPKLPAETMENSCYAGMFSGCSSLIMPPALPSTDLAPECYRGMFSNCINLEYLPVLPARMLENFCYCDMFKDCSNIKVSSVLDLPEYSWIYIIQCDTEETESSHFVDNMFSGTGGSFSGTPIINVEYYIPNKPIQK